MFIREDEGRAKRPPTPEFALMSADFSGIGALLTVAYRTGEAAAVSSDRLLCPA